MGNSRLSPIVVGHAVTVIIVVCVGFLVFMIVLGVIRIRAAHHRSNDSREDDQEMAWDDSSLTITVNPLDVSYLFRFTLLSVVFQFVTFSTQLSLLFLLSLFFLLLLFSSNKQQIEQTEEPQQALQEEEEESESSDDGSSYRDDGESSEEEVETSKGKMARSQLEWDDSTLNF